MRRLGWPDRGQRWEIPVAVTASFVPMLWRGVTGSLRIPAGDAWAYERIVQVFHDTGHLHGVGWNDITLLGVLVPAWPWLRVLGFGHLQLAALTCVFAVLALLAVRSVLTSLGVTRGRLLLLATIGVFSGFMGTTGTFLVDLYAFAGCVTAVAAVLHMLDPLQRADARTWHPRPGAEVVAVAGALFAFSVRQQTAVVPLALGLYLWRTGYPRRRLLTVCGSWLALALVFYGWRQQLDHGGKLLYPFGPRSALAGSFALVVQISFGLVPIVLATAAWRRVLRSRALRVLAAAMALAVTVAGMSHWAMDVFALDTLDQLVGAPGPVRLVAFALVGVVCAMAGVALFDAVADQLVTSRFLPRVLGRVGTRPAPSATTLLAVLTTATLASDVVVTVVSAYYSPRYSLVSITMAALLLTVLGGAGTRVTRPALAALAAWTVIGLFGLDNASINGRVWFDGARRAVCQGIPAERVDGGFTWNGVHQGTADRGAPARPDDGFPTAGRESGALYYPTLQRDALVSLKPFPELPGFTSLPPVTVHGLLPGNHVTAYILVRSSAVGQQPAGCDAA